MERSNLNEKKKIRVRSTRMRSHQHNHARGKACRTWVFEIVAAVLTESYFDAACHVDDEVTNQLD